MGAAQRAVVIGASLAGLVAARVLRDHFDEVLIVERDHLPNGPEPRSGVPQSRHIHVLLVRGARILEELFPGFRDELIQGGAPTVAWPSEVLWLAPAGWVQRTGTSVELISASRDFLDWTVRQRVLGNNGARVLEGHDVVALLASDRRARVTGVTVRSRADDTKSDLEADLVVDASGRNSQAPAWLGTLGYPPPRDSVVNAFLGYASRVYVPPDGIERDWKAILLTSRPPDVTRSGGLFPLNGGLWHVTLAGVGRDYPPTDESGFIEFARTLRSSVLYDALADAIPVTSVSGYRRTENQLRHFDRMSSFPDRIRRARRRGIHVQSGVRARHERRWPVGSPASAMAAGRRHVRFVPERACQGSGDALAARDKRGLPIPDDRGCPAQRVNEADAPIRRPRDGRRHGRQPCAGQVHWGRAPDRTTVSLVPPAHHGPRSPRSASEVAGDATTSSVVIELYSEMGGLTPGHARSQTQGDTNGRTTSRTPASALRHASGADPARPARRRRPDNWGPLEPLYPSGIGRSLIESECAAMSAAGCLVAIATAPSPRDTRPAST